MRHELKILFDNKEAAEHFASWLCGQGEQDYWAWAEDGIPAHACVREFKYHSADNKWIGADLINTVLRNPGC